MVYPQQLKGKILLKGKKFGGLLPAGGENGPEATDVSDEDEAAEMEDEAVRSQVQQKPKVLGEAVGRWGGPRSVPLPLPLGCLPRLSFSVAAIQTFCPLSLSDSSLSVIWVSGAQCPPCPTLWL